MSGDSPQPAQVEAPRLRIITPGTTPEEVAAIVAVFAGLGTGGAAEPEPVSAWAAPAGRLRQPTAPGRGAWRLSGLPRGAS